MLLNIDLKEIILCVLLTDLSKFYQYFQLAMDLEVMYYLFLAHVTLTVIFI